MKLLRSMLLLTCCSLAWQVPALAQEYPSKAVRIVVPYAPGATTDALARMLAQDLSKRWGQPVVVENVPGASGGIGAQVVANATADGHTLLVTPGGVLTTNLYLYSKLNYDPDAFLPVAVVARTPLVVVASTKSEINSMQELLSLGRTKSISYASQGVGNMAHLAPELLKSTAQLQMTHIPYKGSAPAINDLVAGHVEVMVCTDLATTLPHIKDGRMRLIAFCDEKRNALFPDVPTVNEFFPGFLASGWFSVSAPPNTPRAVVEKISMAVADVLRTGDAAKRRITALNVEPVGSTPEEMAQMIVSERRRWGKVIRDNAIKAD